MVENIYAVVDLTKPGESTVAFKTIEAAEEMCDIWAEEYPNSNWIVVEIELLS